MKQREQYLVMSKKTKKKISERNESVELSPNGESLYVKFLGLKEFKKQVIFFHDVGEYHDRYLPFAKFLNEHKIGCTFIDMRGHGLSSGTRGHVDDFHIFKSDYLKFWEVFESHYEDKELVTIGHGVGCLVAMMFLLEKIEILGMALINPTVHFKKSKTFHIEELIGRSSIADKVKINAKFMGEDVTSEKNLAQNYDHDPLINKKITVGMYKALLELFSSVKRSAYYINRPVFMALGLEDRVVDREKSELFASSIDENHLTLKKYKDLGHEFFNEIDRDNAFKDIYNWIDKSFTHGNKNE